MNTSARSTTGRGGAGGAGPGGVDQRQRVAIGAERRLRLGRREEVEDADVVGQDEVVGDPRRRGADGREALGGVAMDPPQPVRRRGAATPRAPGGGGSGSRSWPARARRGRWPGRGARTRRRRAVRSGRRTTTVSRTTLTVIRPEALGEADEAEAWLAALRADPDALAAEIADALTLVNLAVHAHRAATLDPALADVAAGTALAVRVLIIGSGEDLADGRYTRAIDVPYSERRRRSELLRPQERVAEVSAAGRRWPPASLSPDSSALGPRR